MNKESSVNGVKPIKRLGTMAERNNQFQTVGQFCRRSLVGHRIGTHYSDIDVIFENRSKSAPKKAKKQGKRKAESTNSPEKSKKRRVE